MCSFHKRDYPLDRFGMLTETRVLSYRERLSLHEPNTLEIIISQLLSVAYRDVSLTRDMATSLIT